MAKALLLDTHIFLWIRIKPDHLTGEERKRLDETPRRYVSAVTMWEIALLAGLDRIEKDPALFTVPQGVNLLPVLPSHCALLVDLPRLHKDPFDRMLIVQARAEGMELMTRDETILSYPAQI